MIPRKLKPARLEHLRKSAPARGITEHTDRRQRPSRPGKRDEAPNQHRSQECRPN
jgi:hypothetical protein